MGDHDVQRLYKLGQRTIPLAASRSPAPATSQAARPPRAS